MPQKAPKPSTEAAKPKKPKQKGRKETQALWSMVSARHKDVLDLLRSDGLKFKFHNDDDPESSVKDWDTNIMGRFACPNRECASRGWPSKAIAVTIRLYPDARYNARIYHQRCRKCKTPGRLDGVDESYAERVAYWLKVWSGVEVERPRRGYERARAPHQSGLCEGCKAGHCKLGEEYLDRSAR